MPLHEDSRDIPTFIVAQGRFRFKRKPMGLINLGNIFHQITDATIRDLEGVMKSLDECLAQAQTLDDPEVILRALFTRCREFNITLSKKKFQLGRSIKFRGYRING